MIPQGGASYSMNYCPYCGTKINPNWDYCPNCSYSLIGDRVDNISPSYYASDRRKELNSTEKSEYKKRAYASNNEQKNLLDLKLQLQYYLSL